MERITRIAWASRVCTALCVVWLAACGNVPAQPDSSEVAAALKILTSPNSIELRSTDRVVREGDTVKIQRRLSGGGPSIIEGGFACGCDKEGPISTPNSCQLVSGPRILECKAVGQCSNCIFKTIIKPQVVAPQ
jgi:hypothetical protein